MESRLAGRSGFIERTRAVSKWLIRSTIVKGAGLIWGKPCPACGGKTMERRQVILWPDLIEDWNLSGDLIRFFNERLGWACWQCGSTAGSRQLARVIVDTVNPIVGSNCTDLAGLCDEPGFRALKVAEINSAGSLHQFLTKLPNLAFSEYGSDGKRVRSEDLMALSYADRSFDLVVTSETLEHVPDIDVALHEIRRVLKPGGAHIFTVPILWERKTLTRAAVVNGELVHSLRPSYHGGRDDRKADFLVFYEFGADFVDRCMAAGFDLRVIRDVTNPTMNVFVAHNPA